MDQRANPHAGHRKRKKEQFLRCGLDAFAPHEALELLLFYAIPRADTNAMAHALLVRFGSLDGVFRAPVEELMRVEGVGESAALLLHLVPQLYKRSQTDLDRRGQAIPDAVAAGDFFKKYFWNERGETLTPVDYFPNFIGEMLRFFAGGAPVAPREETLAVMALMEAAAAAQRRPGEWVKVPSAE